MTNAYYKKLSNQIEGTYECVPFATSRRDIDQGPVLTSLLGMTDSCGGSVRISIDSLGYVRSTLRLSLDSCHTIFLPCDEKSNHYQVTFSNEVVKKVFVAYNEISWVRLALENDSTLIVDQYFNDLGHFLIFAGGQSYRHQYYFRKI